MLVALSRRTLSLSQASLVLHPACHPKTAVQRAIDQELHQALKAALATTPSRQADPPSIPAASATEVRPARPLAPLAAAAPSVHSSHPSDLATHHPIPVIARSNGATMAPVVTSRLWMGRHRLLAGVARTAPLIGRMCSRCSITAHGGRVLGRALR